LILSAAIQAFSAAGGTGRQGDGSRFPAEFGRETNALRTLRWHIFTPGNP